MQNAIMSPKSDLRRSQFTMTPLAAVAWPPRPRSWWACCSPGTRRDGAPLEELDGLAAAAGARVVGQLAPAPRGPRRRHLSRQRQGRGTHQPGRRHATPTWSSSTTTSSPGADPQPGTDRRREGPRPHRADPRHLRQPRPDARGPAGRRAGPVGIRHAAAEADVDPPLAAEEGGSDCADRAKNNWKTTAAWSNTASATCGASSTRSSTAASAKWLPGGAR